jgi:hypothetical protein
MLQKEKLALIKKAVDCVCLNDSSRTKFEIMARDVFRKYMALYPEEAIKPFLKDCVCLILKFLQVAPTYGILSIR